jgi:hypothetical protein
MKMVSTALIFGNLKGSITDVDELDWSVPGLKNDTANFQGGILVWHIDENVIEAKIGSNTINTDIDHRGVDVEEAKGSQDIGVVVPTPIGDLDQRWLFLLISGITEITIDLQIFTKMNSTRHHFLIPRVIRTLIQGSAYPASAR